MSFELKRVESFRKGLRRIVLKQLDAVLEELVVAGVAKTLRMVYQHLSQHGQLETILTIFLTL
jgi:hypothetical protein